MTSFAAHPRATYDGTTIVLNLPDAMHPTVWRYDLSYVPGASFEIVPEGAAHCLHLKTSTGATHTIALYATKEAAINVLSMIIDTMSRPSDESSTAAIQTPSPGLWDTRSKRMTLLSVIIFITLSTIFLGTVGIPRQDPRLEKRPAPTAPTGVMAHPRAAEDVLNERLHKK